MNKMRLYTPGPTSVPEEVLLEMAKPVFHHRTQQYKDLFAKVNEGLVRKQTLVGEIMYGKHGCGTRGCARQQRRYKTALPVVAVHEIGLP